MTLKVVVADDSILFRRAISEALTSCPGVEVVASTPNGKLAVQKVRELRPDLLTLDLEMPEMDGLAVLDALRQAGEGVAVIVVSALTRRGGDLTVRALQKGAFDFISKPDSGTPEQSRDSLRRELTPRINTLIRRLEVRTILRSAPPARPAAAPAHETPTERPPAPSGLGAVAGRMTRIASAARPEMVLIGVSTGGPAALAQVIPAIPADIGVPILIVQHMPPLFTESLAKNLASKSAIGVREASQGEPVRPGIAYIAPGGQQMRLAVADGRPIVQLTDDPPENNCRPAVDYLFRSAASLFPGRSTAAVLTGMGSDGTIGARLLKRHGCYVIAQNEATCVVYGMPKAAVDAGVVDAVLPLEAIAARIIAVVRGSVT
jgi:two-component system, chemotaxis family, protein-glutamate methylesterase/glutaminase